jgi:hypothetical protein
MVQGLEILSGKGFGSLVSGVRQFAYSLKAVRLGSQEARRDEASEHSSIQAFQPSIHFTDTLSRQRRNPEHGLPRLVLTFGRRCLR